VEDAGRWRALTLLATALLLAMTTWFSATAVVPQLTALWSLSTAGRSLLTIAVQVGFVVGAVVSAVLTLPDVVNPRRVFLLGAVGAAAANLGLLVVDGAAGATALRFATGVCLAGVYPPAMKTMAGWFVRGRGLALGVMVGALTAGSAVPHLVNALGGLDWRLVIVATSGLTVVGGLIAELAVADGPARFASAPADPRQVLAVLRDREVRLASIGYFGHMWELYAMWAWIGTFYAGAFAARDLAGPVRAAALTAFATIAIGAAGCVVGGRLADRRGRSWLTSLAMILSGSCAILIGLVSEGPLPLLLLVGAFWGFWVVADSAQFSTVVTEVADQRYVGTALTLQLAIGFSLTVATIWLVPWLADQVGWRWAFVALAPGPAAGTVAMLRLRATSDIA
jgi:MFS family permease